MLAEVAVVAWIAVVCGLSVVAFLLILIAPWQWFGVGREDRRERRLDEDVETRLLLGEDPDELAAELDADAADRSPVAELRRDESA